MLGLFRYIEELSLLHFLLPLLMGGLAVDQFELLLSGQKDRG